MPTLQTSRTEKWIEMAEMVSKISKTRMSISGEYLEISGDLCMAYRARSQKGFG